MKEIILPPVLDLALAHFLLWRRAPIPAPNVLPSIIYCVFMYIGYLVVKSIFYQAIW